MDGGGLVLTYKNLARSRARVSQSASCVSSNLRNTVNLFSLICLMLQGWVSARLITFTGGESNLTNQLLNPQDSVTENGFLLLRSKSYNTVSQLEVTGLDTYSISDINKGGKFIDLSIQTSRVNLTSYSKGSYYHRFPKSDVLVMKTFFSGKAEKKRRIAILTNKTLDVYEASLKEEQGESYKWTVSVGDVTASIPECAADYSCGFSNLVHKSNSTQDLYFLELKLSPKSGDFKLKMLLLSMESTSYPPFERPAYTLQTFDMPRLRFDPGDNSAEFCAATETLVVDIPRGGTGVSLIVARYCTNSSTDSATKNALYFEGIAVDDTGNSRWRTFGVFSKFAVQNHDSGELSEIRLLRLMMSNHFLIMATTEGFFYFNWSELAPVIVDGRSSVYSAGNAFPMYLLHSQPMSQVFCNFLNMFELCCTVAWKPSPSQTLLKVVELVNLETNIVVANLPLGL